MCKAKLALSAHIAVLQGPVFDSDNDDRERRVFNQAAVPRFTLCQRQAGLVWLSYVPHNRNTPAAVWHGNDPALKMHKSSRHVQIIFKLCRFVGQ